MKTFPQLLSASNEHFFKHWKILIVGAVIFSVILGGVNMFMAHSVQKQVNSSVQNLGFNQANMDEYQRRLEQGDEAALQEMLDKLGQANANLEGMSEADRLAYFQEKAANAVFDYVPMMIGMALVMFLVSMFMMGYYIIQAVDNTDDIGGLVTKSLKYVFPFLGLSIWIALRSFLWIPFIGFFIAIVLIPRLSLANVIMVKEGTGIMESASLSYKRTKGHWWKIFGNIVLAMILIMIVCLVAQIVAGMLGMLSWMIPLALSILISQIAYAYGTIFYVKLAKTVMANPVQ